MLKKCEVCGGEFRTFQTKAKYCGFPCRREAVRKIGREYAEMKRRSKQKEGTVNCTQAVRKTCKYGMYGIQEWTCDYISIEGHMRGCPCEECDKYVKVKNPGRKTPWRLKRN